MNEPFGPDTEHVLPTLLEQYHELGVKYAQALGRGDSKDAEEIHDRRMAILKRIREKYPHFDQEQEAA